MALFGHNKELRDDMSNRRVVQNGSSADRRPNFNDLTVGDVSSGVPRIRLGEFFGSLKRQMIWFIPLFVLGVLAVLWLTKDLKRVYHADGTILVQLGSEYVYDPIGSDQNNGAGLSITPDYIVLNEIALMKNSDTIVRVIGELETQFGSRFAEDNFKKRSKAAVGSRKYNDALVELQTIVNKSFGVSAQPKSSILSVSYKHEDPEIAKAALNLFIDAYLDFRRTIFVEGSGEVITERRVATEEQLKANQRAISRLLINNGVSDFESERAGVTDRTEELREGLNTLRADISENERALASVEDQLRNTPEQLDLQIDDRSSQRIAQAELELGQLLAKYLPSSQPVRRKQSELEELRRLQDSYGGTPRGGRRVGPNGVYQSLLTRRNLLQSTADALREKEVIVQRQLDSADSKVRKLQRLSPKYSDLLRERDTLDERLKDYTTKEQEAIINQQQAQANSENVRVIDRASQARKGRNTKYLMLALGVGGWGVTLGVIALMRVFLDPALYVGNAVRGRRQSDDEIMGQNMAAEPEFQPQAQTAYASGVQPYIPEPVAAPQPMAYAAMTPAAPASYADPHQAPPQMPQQMESQPQPQPYQALAPQQYQEPMPQHQANPYVPLSYAGNAAHDIYANPYVASGTGGYNNGPSVNPAALGQLPRSPEG
jgi:uncharacterized protein involved in exopolysaccharide biosynthesis